MDPAKLAIDGGEPARKTPFPVWPYFWEEDKKAVLEVLDSNKPNYWTGFRGLEFQQKYAAYTGVKHAIAVNSGTSALHVAVAAVEIGPGAEVIVPADTFIATAACVYQNNGIPIFADVDPATGNIDPADVERKVTENTRAVIPVHLWGLPADMDAILAIARRYNLKVIEDCAQAHGAEYKGKKIGAIGDVNAFSMCQDKIITTGGEGGMVTTDDDEAAELARSVKDHGFWEEERRSLLEMEALYPYIHHRLGWNYRMTEMQTVIGLNWLAKLDWMIDRRRQNAHFLTENLGDLPALNLPKEPHGVKHAYYKYLITLNLDELKVDRDTFVSALRAEGLPAHPGVPTENYREEVFQKKVGYGKTSCPFECPWYKGKVDYTTVVCEGAREHGKRCLILQVHPTLELSDMEDVAKGVRKVVNAYAR